MAKKSNSNKSSSSKKSSSKKVVKQKVSQLKPTQQTKAVKEENSHPEIRMVKVLFVNGTHMMIPMCYSKDEMQLQSDIHTARAWASDKSKYVVGTRASKMSSKFGFSMDDPSIAG